MRRKTNYRCPQKHDIHKTLLCDLFLPGCNYSDMKILARNQLACASVSHGTKRQLQLRKNCLDNSFCCQVSVTITLIIPVRIIDVICLWTMVTSVTSGLHTEGWKGMGYQNGELWEWSHCQPYLSLSSSQPRDWKSSWRGFLGSSGGFERKFPEGGLDFLEVALV